MIDDGDKAKLGAFLRALLNGTADLGLTALPLLALYAKAKKEGVPFIDLLLADPGMCTKLMEGLKRRAKTLPPVVRLALLEALKDD